MKQRQAICDYLMGWISARGLNSQTVLKVEYGERGWDEIVIVWSEKEH